MFDISRIDKSTSQDIAHGFQLLTRNGGCARVFFSGKVDIAGIEPGKSEAINAFKAVSVTDTEMSRTQKRKAKKGLIR